MKRKMLRTANPINIKTNFPKKLTSRDFESSYIRIEALFGKQINEILINDYLKFTHCKTWHIPKK
jgi:hypothetical protein